MQQVMLKKIKYKYLKGKDKFVLCAYALCRAYNLPWKTQVNQLTNFKNEK